MDPYKFNFTDTGYRDATSIHSILGYYKYSTDENICKKPNSIFLINLISPRIDYGSQGKSRINHLPFLKVISKTIEDACKGGKDKDGKEDQIVGLREVLKKEKGRIPCNHKIH